MRLVGNLDNKPVCLKLSVLTAAPKKMYLRVYDKDKPYSEYTNRFATVDGEQDFFIRMPLSPKTAVIEIAPEEELRGGAAKAKGYKVLDLKKLPLKKKLSAFNSASPVIRNFVAFAQDFCQKAGYISANGSLYVSDDGLFQIDYLDEIIDENSKVLNTPARINRHTAIIEVSKNKFKDYTIPMRMAILCHEFSHYYLNEDMSNETEADLNALLIYLGLGYPRIDAYNVFTKVFAKSNNDANLDRMGVIDSFIRNFEAKHIDMQYDESNLYKNFQ
jgi:hypothetical protein